MNIDQQPAIVLESDYQPRVKLLQNVRKFAGETGWIMLMAMFDRPFEAFTPNPQNNQAIADLARLTVHGLIALRLEGDGWQLTADGRYYVAQQIVIDRLWHKKMEDQARRDRAIMDSVRYGFYDEFEPQPFDLDEF